MKHLYKLKRYIKPGSYVNAWEEWQMKRMSSPNPETNPSLQLFHTPQYSIQNKNVHFSILNGALWDIGQMHCGIYKLD